jgi:TRAP-type C4-dicarboxylate transport system permease small subunit
VDNDLSGGALERPEDISFGRSVRAAFFHPLEVSVSLILIALTLITLAQVIFRYVLYQPLSWSEEALRFLMMWLAMLGAAYAFKRHAHFSLAFLLDRLNGLPRKIVVTLNAVALVSFMIVFVIKAVELVKDSLTQIAPATGIPMAVPYSSAIVGGLLIIYYIVRIAWREIWSGQRPRNSEII